jgi:hypothetical protein
MTVAIPLKSPISISISETTGSGKTSWIYRFLKNKKIMLEPPPQQVLYCYGIWQDMYVNMEKNINGIIFHEGIPSMEQVKSMQPFSMIVLDDLAHAIYKNKDIELLFSQVSHHNKISVCILKNNIYYQGKHARTIDLNTHIFILLQNPRDESQILTMGRQIFPSKPLSLLEAYKDCMELTGYLLLDLQPYTNKKYRMRTRIFPDEDPIIFITN